MNMIDRKSGSENRYKWTLTLGIALGGIIYVPYLSDPSALAKATYAYLGTLLILILYLTSIVRNRQLRLHRNPVFIPMAIFIAVSTLAVTLSPTPLASLVGRYLRYDTLPLLWCYAVIVYLASEVYRERLWQDRLITALAIVSGSIAAISIMQGLALLPAEFIDAGHIRSNLPFGNPVMLGGYWAMILPLLVAVLISGRRVPLLSAPSLAIIIGLDTVSLIMTDTRGAWIAVALTIVGVLSCLRYLKYPVLNRRTFAMVVVVSLIVVLIALTAMVADRDGLNRFFATFSRATSIFDMRSPSIAGRFLIWDDSVHMIAERPLAGYGLDQMAYWSPRFKSIQLSRISNTEIADNSHNEFLQAAISSGIFGMLTYLWILITAITIIVRRLRDKSADVVDSLPFLAAVIGFLVQGISGISAAELSWTFWAILGAAVAVGTGISHETRIKVNTLKWALAALTVASVLAFVVVMRPLAASFFMREADLYSDHDLEVAVSLNEKVIALNPNIYYYRGLLALRYVAQSYEYSDPVLLEQSIDMLEQGLKLNPNDFSNHVMLGDTRYYLAQARKDTSILEQAIADYEKAVELYPYGIAAHNGLVSCCMVLGRYERAQAEAQKILAVDPNNIDTLLNLGKVSELTGNSKKASGLYRRVLEVDPNNGEARRRLRALK